jgi:hypothetical protein
MSSTLTRLPSMQEEVADDEPRIVVIPTENMDREAFCKHMTYRHHEALAGLDSLDPSHMSKEVEGMYRSFHRHLHNPLFPLHADPEHDHEQGGGGG